MNMIKAEENKQKETRLVIWRALSELFLDDVRDVRAYQSIANVIQTNGLPLGLVEHILWQEVFPVLEKNLSNVAGVWSGWSDDWLLENLSVRNVVDQKTGRRSHIKIIEEEWAQVCAYLSRSE